MRALHVHVVLEGNGHARQRPHVCQTAFGDCLIDLARLLVGRLFGHFEERVDLRVDRRNARQRVLGDLARGELLPCQARLDFAHAHRCEVRHYWSPPPRIAGIRK